ncbi:MAG: peptide-methionine (R)-S-oxide reductase [Anaerolineaceae bacterium]|jgi:peptide-methionine (R)-S-oxide reductase
MQKLFKTDSQWRELLSEEQCLVTGKKGTKASFCEIFYAHSRAGIYHCSCCNLPSFSSEV